MVGLWFEKLRWNDHFVDKSYKLCKIPEMHPCPGHVGGEFMVQSDVGSDVSIQYSVPRLMV